MRPQNWREITLGNEPPLAVSAGPPDRRPVNMRWMAGTVLIGVTASVLLGGAMLAALGESARFTTSPVIVVPAFDHQVVADEARGDRSVHRIVAKGVDRSAVRIEQLSDSGSVRPFTRVSARLAEIDPDQLSDSDHASAQTPTNDQIASLQSSAPQLPPIILYGGSRPALPSGVSAYADDGPDRPKAPLPFGEPLNVTSVGESPASPQTSTHTIIARAGDRLSAILSGLAVQPQDSAAIVTGFLKAAHAERDIFSGGETISLVEEAADSNASPGHVLTVTIERSNAAHLVFARDDAGLYRPVAAEQRTSDPATKSVTPGNPALRDFAGETLHDSLDALTQSNHLDPAIIAEFMRLCAHDFDLDQPLAATDATDILYAPNDLGQPELVYVALTAQGKAQHYYRFTASDDASTDFYNGDGASITKFLLRKPVAGGRLNDAFGWRMHPILHSPEFHQGVDYDAPYGSPIAAAGAGVIELISQESGYGKYIRVRHDLGYETTYAHVSGFPRGLKVGDRVRQGETIAYVGSTGLSTGSHLYYEVKINGHNVDPLRIKLLGGRVLRGEMLAQFAQAKQSIDELVHVPAQATANR